MPTDGSVPQPAHVREPSAPGERASPPAGDGPFLDPDVRGGDSRAAERIELAPRTVVFHVDGTPHEGELRNVSDAGCLVVHDGPPLVEGAPVTLEVPSRWALFQPIRARGCISWTGRWSDGRRTMGVHFEGTTPRSVRRMILRALVGG